MISFSIIIPHFNGERILADCLNSLFRSQGNFEVILVDNGSTDQSIEQTRKQFPQVKIAVSGSNLGYAGGCTFGADFAKNEWLIFLNNDVEVAENWLTELETAIHKNPGTEIFQPKILSLQAHRNGKKIFDYAGGAGGRIDFLGYPFAYGRIMWKVIEDFGKYDETKELFWASGTALVIKSETAKSLSFFDTLFFAHMEEIDLCWRLHQIGGSIKSVPSSVVYHLGGQTLALGNPQKIYLNHRNNWYLTFKNFPLIIFILTFPPRLFLDIVAMFFYTLQKGKEGFVIIPRAYQWLIMNLTLMISNRRKWIKFKKDHPKKTGYFSVLKKMNKVPVVFRIPLQALKAKLMKG